MGKGRKDEVQSTKDERGWSAECGFRIADWGLRNGRTARYAVGGRTAGHQRLGISHEQPQWPNKAISHLSRRPATRRDRKDEVRRTNGDGVRNSEYRKLTVVSRQLSVNVFSGDPKGSAGEFRTSDCGLRNADWKERSGRLRRANHETRSTAQAHRRRVTNHGPRVTIDESRVATRWLRWAVGGSDRGSAGAARASSSMGTHGPCHRRRRCRGGFGNRAAC